MCQLLAQVRQNFQCIMRRSSVSALKIGFAWRLTWAPDGIRTTRFFLVSQTVNIRRHDFNRTSIFIAISINVLRVVLFWSRIHGSHAKCVAYCTLCELFLTNSKRRCSRMLVISKKIDPKRALKKKSSVNYFQASFFILASWSEKASFQSCSFFRFPLSQQTPWMTHLILLKWKHGLKKRV